MKSYACHKVVQAAQIMEILGGVGAHAMAQTVGMDVRLDDGTEFFLTPAMLARSVPLVGDYVVKYKDGYISHSPKVEFEDGYSLHQADALSFGAALSALKRGFRVARRGWNGKDMWIAMMPALQLPAFSAQDTQRKVNDRTARFIGIDTPLDSQPYIAMWTAQQKWQPGWLASQNDMLAEDWYILPDRMLQAAADGYTVPVSFAPEPDYEQGDG